MFHMAGTDKAKGMSTDSEAWRGTTVTKHIPDQNGARSGECIAGPVGCRSNGICGVRIMGCWMVRLVMLNLCYPLVSQRAAAAEVGTDLVDLLWILHQFNFSSLYLPSWRGFRPRHCSSKYRPLSWRKAGGTGRAAAHCAWQPSTFRPCHLRCGQERLPVWEVLLPGQLFLCSWINLSVSNRYGIFFEQPILIQGNKKILISSILADIYIWYQHNVQSNICDKLYSKYQCNELCNPKSHFSPTPKFHRAVVEICPNKMGHPFKNLILNL